MFSMAKNKIDIFLSFSRQNHDAHQQTNSVDNSERKETPPVLIVHAQLLLNRIQDNNSTNGQVARQNEDGNDDSSRRPS